VHTKPNTGALWLADQNNQLQVEKVLLLKDDLDDPLRKAFSAYEAKDLQFGEIWLRNLASHALDEQDIAVVFTARLSPNNFVACPLKLNSRTGSAHALSTFYTSTYSPVVCSNEPEKLFTALFQHLARIEKLAAIALSPMDIDSPHFGLVHTALARAGWQGIHNFFCSGNWIHDLGGASYQAYLAGRPSQVGNTVSRRTRQFLDANRGQLRIVQGGEFLEEAIAQFIAVYNSSWKREEPYPEFIPQLLRLSAKRGWLRLGIAEYDSKPVASQVWLVSEGTAYIFKLAYHEDFKQLSPGTVLTAFMMEHVIEKDRVVRIDYLSGDDDYKKNWMSVRRERHGIAAYNPRTLHGSGLLISHTLKNHYKAIFRRSWNARPLRNE
jgi:hypothetical protein